jgi:hypothetical protein
LGRTIEVAVATEAVVAVEAAVATKAAVEVPIMPTAAAPPIIKETLTTWTTVLLPMAKTKAALLRVLLIKGPLKITWVHLPISVLKTLMPWNQFLSTTGAMLTTPLWN